MPDSRPNSGPSEHPRQSAQKLLKSAAGGALIATLLGSVCCAVVADSYVARDFLVGGCIGFLPHLWFLLSSSRRAVPQQLVALSLGKFALSAAGFALWFATVPGASALATLAGTATVIVTMTVAMAMLLRGSGAANPGDIGNRYRE